jgi:hypothetical protein
MGDHLAFARLAHAITLHGLGEDHGRLPRVLHGRRIGSIDLHRVAATTAQRPDVIVAHVLHERGGFRILAEELLAHVCSVLRLEILVLAVDALLHALAQHAGAILGEQLVPSRAPQHFDDVPAGAAEHAFQLLHDLAVAANRTVKALQIAVDDEDQIVELLAAAKRNGAERFRLVHLAVTHEGPHFARGGIRNATPMQVFQEPRLVDRHQRP